VVQNLRDTLDEVCTTHHDTLTAVKAARHQQPVPLPDGTLAVPVPPPPLPARAAQQAAQRQARAEQGWPRHRQGWPSVAIAAQGGCSCRTIERYLHRPTWPVRQQRRHYGRSLLNPYQA
jgi:hypothetical protein